MSLLLAASFVAALYGVPALLCRTGGPRWLWSLAVMLLLSPFHWTSKSVRARVKSSLVARLAFSAFFGLLATVYAYVNPGAFASPGKIA